MDKRIPNLTAYLNKAVKINQTIRGLQILIFSNGCSLTKSFYIAFVQ